LSQSTSLQFQGSDPDGQAVSHGATGLPPGLTLPGFSLNASTGSISGSPTARGSFTVMVQVSDGSLIATRTFTWMVKRR
jgi:hypothetical protein